MTALPNGTMPYKNLFDCIGKEIANNGLRGLYVGLPTFITQIAPHAIILFIASEKLKKVLL